MSCQIFSGDAAGNALSTVKAIKYAADNGAVVLQCAWGYVSGLANSYEWGDQGFKTQEEWEQACPLEKEALEYFIHNAGSPNGPIEEVWRSSPAATKTPPWPDSPAPQTTASRSPRRPPTTPPPSIAITVRASR